MVAAMKTVVALLRDGSCNENFDYMRNNKKKPGRLGCARSPM
jgi:hypothetical protein